ncbi:MAG: hypothetical protein FJ189_12595, partial [Gammaproteobacteria bacterium]|nr:hypothetical protein [Gammaproteobacteria bacterium]
MNTPRESFISIINPVAIAIRWFAPLALAGALAACDDGAKTSSSGPSSMEAKIEGNIQDQHGPIMNSRLEVTDKSGEAVQSTELTANNHYSIRVPAGTTYPIVLTAYPT